MMMQPRPFYWRRTRNLIFLAFNYLMAAISVSLLLIILYTMLKRGIPHFNLALFTQTTPPPGTEGGLKNAILGSLYLSCLGILIATPIGILIATYLVEYSNKSRYSKFIRFFNDILLGIPSIITGLFIYATCVVVMGGFSALSGVVALTIIAIPMIVRTTEDVLYLISPMLREAAIALGVPRWRVTVSIVYRAGLHGMITAMLLALARISGETAPLLFTVFNNQYSSSNLLKPMANLPVVIYQYATSPYPIWNHLAWSGALLITIFVLITNLFARYLAVKKQQ